MVIGLGLGMLIGRAGHSSPVRDSIQTAVENAQANPGGQPTAQQQPAAQPQQPAQEPQKPEPQKPEPQPEPQKPETTPTTEASAAAIKYLDDNNAWNKAELDKFPELRGLFEDLNSYNFSKIINVWGPKLSKSSRFQQVVGSAINCQTRKKFVPKAGETYCKTGDTKITVYPYRCRIDP